MELEEKLIELVKWYVDNYEVSKHTTIIIIKNKLNNIRIKYGI